jgi:hypothetical protein
MSRYSGTSGVFMPEQGKGMLRREERLHTRRVIPDCARHPHRRHWRRAQRATAFRPQAT